MAEVALKARTLGDISHSIQEEVLIIRHVLNGTDGVLSESGGEPATAETMEARLDSLRDELEKILAGLQVIRERVQVVSRDI